MIDLPAHKKTREDRLREAFDLMYRSGKSITRLKDTEIAEQLGLKSVKSLTTRKQDPATFRFGEILILSAILQWSEQDVAKLFTLMKT